MKNKHWARRLFALAVFLIVIGGAASLAVGYVLGLPARAKIGNPPNDLPIENVSTKSESGNLLSGWFIPGKAGRGVVLLLHGVRGNRLAMLARARFLHNAGYASLLIDLSSHGESEGKQISFGAYESLDVIAAVDYLTRKLPNEKIGIIGVSLGGASTLLAAQKIRVNAVVVESVYPTITSAITNRLTMRLGRLGAAFVPLLTTQLKLRLDVTPDDLRPIDKISQIGAPIFVMSGTKDQHTKISESEALFAAAIEPKEFWSVTNAAHVDLHNFTAKEYEQKILSFFQLNL